MSQFAIIGTPLYQWESGRKLRITPLRGMTVDSVHFSNYGDSTALVVKPKEENGHYIADIPNILLQDDQNIVVYSVNVSEDKVETIRECVFPVRKRAKPSSYVYTETEVKTWENHEQRIKDLEKGGNGFGQKPPYIASDEPPEDTDALWIDTTPPVEAVALGVTAVETAEGVDIYATDELGTVKTTVRHGKDGDPGTDGREIEVGYDRSSVDGGTNYLRFRYRGETNWTAYQILNGKKGEPGADGITPHIGDNGNWWIGDSDTGKSSRGPAGPEYELTEDDRQDIAERAAELVPGGGGGETEWITLLAKTEVQIPDPVSVIEFDLPEQKYAKYFCYWQFGKNSDITTQIRVELAINGVSPTYWNSQIFFKPSDVAKWIFAEIDVMQGTIEVFVGHNSYRAGSVPVYKTYFENSTKHGVEYKYRLSLYNAEYSGNVETFVMGKTPIN